MTQAASRSHRLTCLGPSACWRTPAVRSLATLLRKPVVDRSPDLLADASTRARFDLPESRDLLWLQHYWKPLFGRHGTSMCQYAHNVKASATSSFDLVDTTRDVI